MVAMIWKRQPAGGKANMATQAVQEQTKPMGHDGAERVAEGSLGARAGLVGNGGSAAAAPASVQGAQPSSTQAGKSSPKMPGKTAAQVLGEIVWILVQSPRHKPLPLSDL